MSVDLSNAQKIFNVKNNYTYNEIKLKLRDLVIKYHPKNSNNTQMFEYIKKCYSVLVDELNKAKQKVEFDINAFNKQFNENKVDNVYDKTGYDKWIESNDPTDKECGAIVHNYDPEPLMMNISGLGGTTFFELGIDSIDNFSGNTDNLQFTDYKIAHSTSQLVDERYVNAPTYKTLEDIQKERSNLSYNMTPEKAKIYQEQQLKQLEQERIRLMNLEKLRNV